jgi:hypothetical protein
MNAYGGANGQKILTPGGGNSKDVKNKGSYGDDLGGKLNQKSDAYLYLIKSSILMFVSKIPNPILVL